MEYVTYPFTARSIIALDPLLTIVTFLGVFMVHLITVIAVPVMHIGVVASLTELDVVTLRSID